jgi:carbamoyltransferase
VTTILGISGYYHDSAAAIVQNGQIIAAAQEERFTRKKHDADFPTKAIKYCLSVAQTDLQSIDYIAFYDKPLLKFDRLLETYLAYAPRGLSSFLTAIPVWLKEKLFLKDLLKKELAKLAHVKTNQLPPLLFAEHHQSHAASAFFPSPFKEAAVMCLDGVGEWATSSVWLGQDHVLTPQWQIDFPHSLGLLYSAFTYYTGFKVNSGEYKLMGLAPYGEPTYVKQICDHLIDIKSDGSFRLNMQYFNYAIGLTMTNDRFHRLFGGPPRKPESEVTQKEMDIARSIQVVTEEIILKLAHTVQRDLQQKNLCLAGGVALNCVANGRLLREGPFENIWVQPAAGDAGGAIGCALSTWHQYLQKPRIPAPSDSMSGSYLGPTASAEEITALKGRYGAKARVFDNDQQLIDAVASYLADEKVIGWCQGRMEFGPRALGNRSIIGDPRSRDMQSVMNLKIKFRESFRPFAPAVKHDKVQEWFEHQATSPYMLMVAPVREEKRIELSAEQEKRFGIEKLKIPRSEVPAITHVDYSARLQTVHPETNPKFYSLLDAFERKTGCPMLINTSFNVRGEPIVCSAEDAYRCFMRTNMDYLVINNTVFAKEEQPHWQETENWKESFTLD